MGTERDALAQKYWEDSMTQQNMTWDLAVYLADAIPEGYLATTIKEAYRKADEHEHIMHNITRLSVNMNPETTEALKSLSEMKNLSLANTIQYAVGLMKQLTDLKQQGNKLLIKSSDGSVRELLL